MLKIAWADIYPHPLPQSHRFPMSKYDLLQEQLLYEGLVNENNFFNPEAISEDRILDTHDLAYWSRLKNMELTKSEIRKTGFPMSPELIDRERHIMQGTLMAADFALQFGCSMNIAGGTHHAFTNRGEGFCLLNDQAIAARYLLNEGKASKILIVDLDVHQGNGTAEIFKNENRVFTFSMHGANNYPLNKELSDWDIPLPDGTEDFAYLNILENALKQILDSFKPDFMFFQSGVDVLKTDKIGRLGLSMTGCRERDRVVFENAFRNNIPIVASMGGGYSVKISDVVGAHAQTFRLAQEIFF